MSRVSLREVTAETLRSVIALRVRPEQEAYVASNAISIAEAYFQNYAWFRAIYRGDDPIGFLMLHDESLSAKPREPDFYYLWRFMIDAAHQGEGLGREAIELLCEHVRTRPQARVLLTSCEPGEHTPEPFYLKAGFERTGREPEGEIELTRTL